MPGYDIYVPTDLRDALSYLDDLGEATSIIARGTDLLPRLRRRRASAASLLDISGLGGDLRYIRSQDGSLHVGALSTVSDLMESPLIGREMELVREAGRKFGDPQIRNVATVGGNICSATSSEDLIPVFLALDARVKLLSLKGERALPLKDFIKGKRTISKKSGEILSGVELGPLPANSGSAYEKLGRRNILIIALVNEAVVLTMEADRETVRAARVALNRVAGRVPQRASAVEEYLAGRRLGADTIAAAQAVLSSELDLKNDFRASGEYRSEIAKVYLKRLLELSAFRIRGT
ncbi:MAG: FAD binding domain-containing protein [Conexivisphaerales archaeon]